MFDEDTVLDKNDKNDKQDIMAAIILVGLLPIALPNRGSLESIVDIADKSIETLELAQTLARGLIDYPKEWEGDKETRILLRGNGLKRKVYPLYPLYPTPDTTHARQMFSGLGERAYVSCAIQKCTSKD